MKFRNKVLLGIGAVAMATAASFPNELGAFYLGPTSWNQREALAVCQRSNSTFIRFLASDRDSCFSKMRSAGIEHTGAWSRHERGARQMADASL